MGFGVLYFFILHLLAGFGVVVAADWWIRGGEKR